MSRYLFDNFCQRPSVEVFYMPGFRDRKETKQNRDEKHGEQVNQQNIDRSNDSKLHEQFIACNNKRSKTGGSCSICKQFSLSNLRQSFS